MPVAIALQILNVLVFFLAAFSPPAPPEGLGVIAIGLAPSSV
jgi:hypothetical protein